ncbi:MAG: prenyltransferase/squalene oxidase repeat-containing protein [Chthoniobacteraceae bacterium]
MNRVAALLAFVGVLSCDLAAFDETVCRETVRRGLARVTKAASDWQKNKTCFSCHHQTLPMLAMTEAARAGFAMDRAWLESQATTTHKYFAQRIEDMDEGEHVPGGATTVGSGLQALAVTARPADATTTAMVGYLLKIQGVARLNGREPSDLSRVENGRWTTTCRRPPMQGSDVADTVLALIGMEKFATAEQRPSLATARAAAEAWLARTPLVTQEDRVWRLWGLHHLGGEPAAKDAARKAIAEAQREDGGWSASDGLESDAFSTGETLFVLCQTGAPRTGPMIQRARDYLIRTQLEDGSWLVKSRVKYKAQPYFENGDPHGEHQFLSTAATAWATAALAQFLPHTP